MKDSRDSLSREHAKRAVLVVAAAGILAVSACSAHGAETSLLAGTPNIINMQSTTRPSLLDIHRYEELKVSSNPQLTRVGQYESLNGVGSVAQASFFVPTPTTPEQASTYAASIAQILHDFAKAEMQPLVFVEPTNDKGKLNLQKYANGAYDVALQTYFAQLKANGVTDKDMGTWVILPEGNMPEWSSVDPTVYAKTVTKTAKIQKQYFPASRTAIMLDSETYPTATSYEGGTYVSLRPYVKDIPHGLIDSVGLQGFPESGVASPSQYLRIDLLTEMAHTLRVKDIWLNTGTFGTAYDSQHHSMTKVSAYERAAQLRDVATKAEDLHRQGFNVAVHLFAENKLRSSEKIDWSYWHGTPSTSTDAPVFAHFAKQLEQGNVALWVFDSPDD